MLITLDQQKREAIVQHITYLLDTFFSSSEKQEILHALLPSQEQGIPLSIFKAPLSGLELITKYLKEHEHRSLKSIAQFLHRKPSTIYNTYAKATQKFPHPLDVSDFSLTVPASLFAQRRYSILELLVSYLKDQRHLTMMHIATLLHRNYNTVKTVYRRYLEKKK